MSQKRTTPKSGNIRRRVADPALQLERLRTLAAYSEMLKQADDKALRQFDRWAGHVRLALWVIIVINVLTFSIGVTLVVVSLVRLNDPTANSFQQLWGLVSLLAGLVGMIVAGRRDLTTKLKYLVADLVKIQVMFLSYLRQSNQIDAKFKQSILAVDIDTSDWTKETAQQVREAVGQAIEEMSQILEESALKYPVFAQIRETALRTDREIW